LSSKREEYFMLRNIKKQHFVFMSLVLLSSKALSQEPFAIYHAFDMQIKEVLKNLPQIAQEGYSHIQLPPLQKSKVEKEDFWFLRYQPTDYTEISGRGSLEELKSLTQEAQEKYGIKIIADVVFNHIASVATRQDWLQANNECWHSQGKNCGYKNDLYSKIKFPTFSGADVNPWCDMQGEDWDNEKRYDCWGDGNWTDLNHSSVYVQNILKEHINILFDAGVSGLRFDAVKHMHPWALDIFARHAQWKNTHSWNYGEVLSTRKSMHQPYQEIMPSTDFLLTEALVKAFSLGGDLRSLTVAPSIGKKDITFARNHDTIHNSGFETLKFKNHKDISLAWAFVLARKDGIPLIYPQDTQFSIVKAGLKFRKHMEEKKAPEYILGKVCQNCNNPNTLIMERGEEGFMVINKSGSPFFSGETNFTLTHLEGCYKELQYGFYTSIEWVGNVKKVTRWGSKTKDQIQIGPQTALLFIKDSWEQCLNLP